MLKIKFRFWDVPNYKMRYWDEWSHLANASVLFESQGSPFPIIPMQYIGLQDKNGKEIYEGDIVFYDYDYKSLQDPFKNRWEVVYHYDQWKMVRGNRETGDQNCCDDPHWNRWEDCEIIGNIYQNPELIRKGN